MCELLVTEMPSSVVLVTLNPWMVIQLLLDITKPLALPVTVALAPGAEVKTIEAVCVPDFAIVTFST